MINLSETVFRNVPPMTFALKFDFSKESESESVVVLVSISFFIPIKRGAQ